MHDHSAAVLGIYRSAVQLAVYETRQEGRREKGEMIVRSLFGWF